MVYASIPMRTIGPIKIIGPHVDDDIEVPLATYEVPLWPSTNRGARVSRRTDGIRVVVVDDRMTRSIALEASTAEEAVRMVGIIGKDQERMTAIVCEGSRFAKLIDVHFQVVANLIYIRFEFTTGDAAGHNMVTKAADQLIAHILQEHAQLKYISISGNYCSDKKVSAVNGILGRGKYIIAEMFIPQDVCEAVLHTVPQKIVEINIKKNLLGSVLAGSLRSANAHFANLLLAFYLATGQDAANIIEGSQGIVHAEIREGGLYFSTTLPNIIVGTVGQSKTLGFVHQNLELLGCVEEREPGENAKRLAVIAAATVLCGELSLLAAQTNPGTLVKSHLALERHINPFE